MIPNYNFITSTLNVNPEDIEYCNAVIDDENNVTYYLSLRPTIKECPYCHGSIIGHGTLSRKINHPILRDRNTTIIFRTNRYICKVCGATCSETNPFSLDRFNSSVFLIQSAMQSIKNLDRTMFSIAKELNISSTQLNTYLDSFVTIPKLDLPEWIGIDEIHSNALSKKNSSYICTITDNIAPGLFDILDTRKKSYLSNYFSNYPRSERLKVKYVTIDMWEAYRDVAKIYFPNCIVAADPFHVTKNLMKAFSKIRTRYMNSCVKGSVGYYLLKSWNSVLDTRYNAKWLNNAKRYNHILKQEVNHYDILKIILDSFPELAAAYWLKESYLDFNENSTYEEAKAGFNEIMLGFKMSKVREYEEFANTLNHWKEEIINSFLRPYKNNRRLSNAYAENTNGRIDKLINISNGIVNFTRFRKRCLYALNPNVHYAIKTNLNSNKRIGHKRGSYHKLVE